MIDGTAGFMAGANAEHALDKFVTVLLTIIAE